MVKPQPAARGSRALANYRLYRLDGAGRIIAAEWIESADDEAARRDAKRRSDNGPFELWEQGRLVERLRLSPKS